MARHKKTPGRLYTKDAHGKFNGSAPSHKSAPASLSLPSKATYAESFKAEESDNVFKLTAAESIQLEEALNSSSSELAPNPKLQELLKLSQPTSAQITDKILDSIDSYLTIIAEEEIEKEKRTQKRLEEIDDELKQISAKLQAASDRSEAYSEKNRRRIAELNARPWWRKLHDY